MPGSPAALFDLVAFDPSGKFCEALGTAFDVLCRPGERLDGDVRDGDIVLRRGLGEGSICALEVIGEGRSECDLRGRRLGLHELILRPRSGYAPPPETVADFETSPGSSSPFEVEIGYDHALFGRFFAVVDDTSALNLFNDADRARLDSRHVERARRIESLRNSGMAVDGDSGNVLVALTGLLVLPRAASERSSPLVMLAHGQAPASLGALSLASEVKSFLGYRYLQRHLAGHGIASLSVNLNVANHVDLREDSLHRVELLLLHWALLKSLVGLGAPSRSLLFFRRSGAARPIPLEDGLGLSPPFPRGSPEERLHALRNALRGRIDFASAGFFGHSRGADAAADIFQFFCSSAGSCAQPQFDRSFSTVNPNLVRELADVARAAGGPLRSSIRCIVALQPAAESCRVDSAETFFLAVASSHDEDVQETSVNIYEAPTSPKAMVFSHGASHARFNTVWRDLPALRRKIARNIDCQNPIHMLSNAGHEAFAKSFIADAFVATLRSEPDRLLAYTGERRAPIPQDVERAWRFAFPFGSTPGVLDLDTRVTRAADVATGRDTPLAKSDLGAVTYRGRRVFAQNIRAFRVRKPARSEWRVDVAIARADDLGSFTHFSFRFAKEIDAFDARSRATEPMQNFRLALFAGTTPVGTPIESSAFPAPIHRPYPTRQWSHEVGASGGCYDDTTIILQTVEVALARLLGSGTGAASRLSTVDRIELRLLSSGRAGDEIFVLTDFLLTTRNLPAASRRPASPPTRGSSGSGSRTGSRDVLDRDFGEQATPCPAPRRNHCGSAGPGREVDPANPAVPPLIYRTGDPARLDVRAIRPTVGHAQQLLNVFLAQLASGTASCPGLSRPGASQRLAQLRARMTNPTCLAVDCFFGDETDRAARMFQVCRGLVEDGKIGPITWPELEALAAPPPPPPQPPPLPALPTSGAFTLVSIPTSSSGAATFWRHVLAGISSGGGVGLFLDGDLRYAAIRPEPMRVIRRTRPELFGDTVRRDVAGHRLKVATNGNLFGLSPSGKVDVKIGNDPVDPAETSPIGQVVVGGSVVAGSSEPNLFHIAFTASPPIIGPLRRGDHYQFAMGDPPSGADAALGGLGPIIVAGLKFGDGNLYRSGVPAGAPRTGPVPPAFLPFLVQRNNRTYVSLRSRGAGVGKGVVALSRSQDALLVLVQPDGASPGIDLDALRDKLVAVGIDDAVFLDGSDSVLLVVNGTFHISQGSDKEEGTTIGLGFQ